MRNWIHRHYVAATLLGTAGLLALLLASVGLYGVMAYSVAQRTREIGIRMALGASRKDVMSLVLKQGVSLVSTGVLIGLGVAFAVMPAAQPRKAPLRASEPGGAQARHLRRPPGPAPSL